MIDPKLFQHDRFTIVTPDLVALAGSANDAIVLAHVRFRLVGEAPHAVECEGQMWWPGTYAEISTWTGLSDDQVRRSIGKLEKSGLLEARKLHLKGPHDHTRAYRVSVRQIDVAESPDLDVAESPDLSSIENIENTLVSADAEPQIDFDALFEYGWAAWPKKDRKKPARDKFMTLVKKHDPVWLSEQIERFGAAYSKAVRETRFVPALVVWLNQERWTDDLPEPLEQHQPASDDWMNS